MKHNYMENLQKVGDLVSIIVPVYNSEKFLHRCIDSLIAQTYTSLEIILIDDGSTDNSGIICEEYAMQDARIKVFHVENQGVCAARNIGIEKANGDFIGFVDSDDFIDESMYASMVEKINDTKCEVCVIGYKILTRDGKVQYKPISEFFNIQQLSKEDILQLYLPLLIDSNTQKRHFFGGVCRCLYKASIIKNERFNPNLKIMEDTIFNLYVFLRVNSVCFVFNCSYNYCVNQLSATESYRVNALNETEALVNELFKIKAKYEIIENKCSISLINELFGLTLFLFKNVKASGKKYDAEIKKEIENIINIDFVRNTLKNYKAKHKKERIFILLIKLRFYRLLFKLL